MDWTEIKITVDTKDIDTAGDIANMVVPYGIYIEDYSDLEREAMEIAHIDLIDEDLLAKDRTKGIVHIYIDPQDHPQEAAAFLTERLAAAGIENEIDLTPCQNACSSARHGRTNMTQKVARFYILSPGSRSARAAMRRPVSALRHLRKISRAAKRFSTSAAGAEFSR